ncbi:MAG: ABC transporter substrate-binding protein, partial [Gaiellaceae bacterium]
MAIAVIVIGSAAGGTQQRAQNLRVLDLGVASTLDPGLATDTTSSNMIQALFEPLVRFGPPPQLKAVPAAAESWTVKGNNVTIKLRKDLKWTNGQQVTASDYVYSWLRAISPELASVYAYQFFGIRGAEAYNSCKENCAAVRSQVAIKALNKTSFQVTLIAPQAWFIQQLNHDSFIPVHRATVEKFGEKWTEPENIVTFGPFKLASWKKDAEIVLVKNTKWRDAKSVKLNRVTLTGLSDA